MTHTRRGAGVVGILAVAWPLIAGASTSNTVALAELSPIPSASTITLPVVQVQAVRLDIPPFDLPASFSALTLTPGASGQPGVNLSEVLLGVPGVLARDRQNYAQDEQLSIRGFGARATFGVRGVRVFADGIPATMPDGQGQLSALSLDAAGRVDVLRGPFSALYGNSSGGVVQLWSAPGGAVPVTTLALAGGSDASWKTVAASRGIVGALNYNVALAHFQTEGYRAHSRAVRDQGNARLAFALDGGGQLTLVFNALSLPRALDPLGLSAAQVRQNPRQTPAAALQFNTRKSVQQRQLGVIYDAPLGDYDTLRLLGYVGRREVNQVLSVPVTAQRSPLSGGGVVDLAGNYGGVDARWTHHGAWLDHPLELVVGLSADAQQQARRGYENFAGERLGVSGRLRRDQRDRVHDVDQYAQLYWHLAPRWALLAGVRHSTVRFATHDRYVTANNPDDSGRVRYAATTPVAGLQYRPTPALRLYGSVGTGFETPTFNELGYRADGGAGLALDLRSARSRNQELGLKWQPGAADAPALSASTQTQPAAWQLDMALFRADTRGELAVASNRGGRSTYRSIGRTRRQGVEFSAHGELAHGWQLAFGVTALQATVRSAFLTCGAPPCAVPNVPVTAGARIPGVPSRYGSLRLARGNALCWRGGIELDAAGAVTVDDRNSARAPGYLRTALEGGYGLALGQAQLHLSARVDNLFDRHIIGSVIVNESNGRYYEPAPGRSVWLAARLEF